MSTGYLISRQRWLYVFLFLLLPLVWWPDLPDPGWAPRLLATATALLVVPYLLLNSISNDLFRSPAAKAWSLFILSSLMMCVASVSPGDGILETLRRATGFSLAIVFGGLLRMNPDQASRLPRWAAGSLLLLLVLFLFDAVPDWFGSRATAHFPTLDYSFGATVGNKNFLAEAILMLVWLLPPGWNDPHEKWRKGLRIISFVSVLFLFLLQSSAVLLALVAGASYYLISRSGWRSWLKVSLLAGIPLLVILLSWSQPMVRDRFHAEYDRFSSGPDLEAPDLSANNSLYERLLMWRNSFLLIGAHPFIGVGTSDWRVEQAQYGVGGTEFLNTGLARFEHPHNEYLLIASEQGIVGLLLFLSALLLLLARTKSAAVTADVQASRAAVVSMMIVACFAYPFSGDLPWYWFMLHAGILMASTNVAEPSPASNRNTPVAFFVVFILMFAIAGSGMRLKAEYHLGQGIAAQLKKKKERSVDEYRKAETFVFKLDRTGTPIAWYAGNELLRAGDTLEAMRTLERARVLNPYHARVLNDLGSVYEKLGYFESARESYRNALLVVPGMIETRLNLAAALYNIGNTTAAFDEMKGIKGAQSLRGRNRTNYDLFSLVIARQSALVDSIRVTDALMRRKYLDNVWTDEKVRNCFGSTKDQQEFLSCMHGQ